jgi:hypothetical protein
MRQDFVIFFEKFLRYFIIVISFSDRFYKKYGFRDEKYEQLLLTTGFLKNIRTLSCFTLCTDLTRTDLPIYGPSVPYTNMWEPCLCFTLKFIPL